MNHRKFTATIILTCVCYLVPHDVRPDSSETISYSEADLYKIQNILNRAASEKWSRFTVADIAVKTGLELAGTPYKGYTLEIIPEQLVVNMNYLDCVTFIETCIAIALTVKSPQMSFETFTDKLMLIRYEDGVIDGYASRLHYTSHWIQNNSKKGILKEIMDGPCSERWYGSINSMSINREKIHQMDDDAVFNRILETENMLNSIEYFYIPKEKFAAIEDRIKHGDIIAFTAGGSGDDVKHVGFAFKKNDRIMLLHASSDSRKVEITNETLNGYLLSKKKFTGIRVVRLN